MDTKVFRRVQRYGWNAATAAYDYGWVPVLESLTRSCVDRADLVPGERVVDIASGPGVAAFMAAAAVGPTGSVLGTDISEKMIALATDRAPARQTPITFARRDMDQLGVPDETFDAALCAFGLMFAADRKAAFREMARVLVPHGRVSVCVWGRRSHVGWAEVFPIIDKHVASDVCPLFFSLGVPGALSYALAQAGLHDTVEERLAVTLTWRNADEACAAMLEGGPVALAWSRFSPEVRVAVRTAYLRSIEPFRHGTCYDVPAEVVFATARKGPTERTVPS